MKKVFLTILIISILIAGCSKQNTEEKNIGVVDNINTVKNCDDISLKANIVNVNQEKKWVSVKLNNTGKSDIDSMLIKILSDENLIAKVKKPLIAEEARVETTNYGNIIDDIGVEVIPLIKINNQEVSCSSKGLILYKKLTK